MAEGEERLEQELQLLKGYAMSNAFYTSPHNQTPNLWIQFYIAKMKPTLQDEVRWGLEYTAKYKKLGSVRYVEKVHAQRRRVAIVHQEIHLWQQGSDVFHCAARYQGLVSSGLRSVISHLQ